jgi:hypothetical protein
MDSKLTVTLPDTLRREAHAVLFDLDGVLVLTEPLKAEAHSATVKALGGNVFIFAIVLVLGVVTVTVIKSRFERYCRAIERGHTMLLLSDHPEVEG